MGLQAGKQYRAIADALRRRRAILFVGAGVSMSVGLPSWPALVGHMLEDLGLDHTLLRSPDVTYQAIAELYRLRNRSIDGLVQWMKAEWDVPTERLRSSQLHRLIVDLDFPLVYTTNYDRNLENSYLLHGRPFQRIASARDLADASPSVTQIVKYHGDVSDGETLVLAESDFFDRLSFDTPLDIKFRSDALASTVLFIGYSMSDLNIRFLLHSLWRAWRRSGLEHHRPPSFLFMHEPNEVQEGVLQKWGVTVLPGQGESSQESLLLFLKTLLDLRDEQGSGTLADRGVFPGTSIRSMG